MHGLSLHSHCNLSPRGDGNTLQPIISASWTYCNLSPRGDGNWPHATKAPTNSPLQFIPARGRKHDNIGFFRFASLLQFIPARGRKRTSRTLDFNFTPLQFIPARGRKRKCIGRINHVVSIAIYPREGTETCAQKGIYHW